MQFGQYIKEQRLLLGISSRKLSEKVGKSSSYVSSIENGHYKPDYELAYDILRELRIEIPHDILGFLKNLGIEVPTILGTPLSLIIKREHDLKTKKENIDHLLPINNQSIYQELYENRQEQVVERLNNIVEQIEEDISNYPPRHEDCEEDSTFESVDKFLTTFTSLMLDSEIEIYQKFHKLMELPLQKLNPVQFQNIIDYVSNLIEYEYVFESGENSKTQKCPHYGVKYKEQNN